MATFDVQQQSAIYADFSRYTAHYPELQQALKGALAALVKQRPADPLEFLAERLREENMHIKLESQEKRIASIRIQARNRGIKDRKRVEDLKHDIATHKAATVIQARERGKEARRSAQYKRSMANMWLYELFMRMASKKTHNVDTASLAAYMESDPDVIAQMHLPRRFVKMPNIYATTTRAFVQALRTDPRAFQRRMDWISMAAAFGLTPEAAEEAVQNHAATKIQAVQRGKGLRKRQGDSRPATPADGGGGGFAGFGMFQRCMTGENDLPPAGA